MRKANDASSKGDARVAAASKMPLAEQETIPPDGSVDTASGGSTAESLPREFGRYRIERRLGQGAMGAVYLAHDTQLDRPVALKVPKFHAGEPDLVKRFYKEARSAATLRNANICPVYDVGEHEGTHYITMAYIEGRPLSSYVNPDKPQSPRQAVLVVRKLAKALQEAHEHGIVHRDLKPANVMIDTKSEPIVMDFGLALQSDSVEASRLTQDGALIGTPAYMSPEQVGGVQDEIGPASDVYSLGVILFELLTGRPPFQGSITSVIAAVVTKSVPPPSSIRADVDAQLDAICTKMTARHTADRFASMKEVADALTQYLRSPGKQTPAVVPSQPSPAESLAQSPSSADSGVADIQELQQQASRARALYKEQKFEQVIAILEQLAAADAGTKQLALCEWARGELPKVRQQWQDMKYQAEILYEMARSCAEREDYVQVIELLDGISAPCRDKKICELHRQAIEKRDVTYLLAQIEAAERQRNDDALEAACRSLLEIYPGHRRAEEALAALVKRRRPERLPPLQRFSIYGSDWPLWRKCITVGSAAFLIPCAAVLLYVNFASFLKSPEPPPEDTLTSDSGISYEDGLSHYNRGGQLYQEGKVDEAIEETRIALRLAPDLTPALVNLTSFLLGRGDNEEALAVSESFIEKYPDHQAAWRSVGYARLANKRYDEAIEAFRERIRLRPNLQGANQDLATALNDYAWKLAVDENVSERDPKRAVKLANEAVELAPSANLWNTLGVVQYRAGDAKSAISSLTKSMDMRNGGDSFDWFFLALSHHQLGNRADSQKWLQDAIQWMEENQPDNEELQRFRDEAVEVIGSPTAPS